MLEWTQAGDGARLMMLVLHDDPVREYAYGPANGLPDTKIGKFSDALMDETKEERLGGDQYEERLETDFRFREVAPKSSVKILGRGLELGAGVGI